MFVLIHQKGPGGQWLTRLLAESGSLKGRMIPIRRATTRVGRGEHTHIAVPSQEEVHFQLDIIENDVFLTNFSELGTSINEVLVFEKQQLFHGDKIGFATYSLEPRPSQKEEEENTSEMEPVSNTDEGSSTLRMQSPHFEEEDSLEDSLLFRRLTVVPQGEDVRRALWETSSFKSPDFFSKRKETNEQLFRQASNSLQLQNRKFEVLLAVSKALSRPEDMKIKADKVLQLLFEIMDFDRAALLVLGEHGNAENLSFEWSTYRDRIGHLDSINFSSTIIRRVLRTRDAVLLQNADQEEWLEDADSVYGQKIRTCICTPLLTSNDIVGVIYADSTRISEKDFSSQDLEFFTTFSNQAAISIENSRLLTIALEKERLEQDIRVAQTIQQWLYPQSSPSIDGFDIAGNSIAMEQVGGDYFDFIDLNENEIAIIVGDVSGHGISSALIMTMTRSALKGILSEESLPARVLQRLNLLISQDVISRMFVTMAIVVLNKATGDFVYSSAGHEPIIQVHAEGSFQYLPKASNGGPLGMSRWARLNPLYVDHVGRLEKGELLFLYTDGFPDATNPLGESMGMPAIENILSSHSSQDATSLLNQLFELVSTFRANSPPDDDTTGVVIYKTS